MFLVPSGKGLAFPTFALFELMSYYKQIPLYAIGRHTESTPSPTSPPFSSIPPSLPLPFCLTIFSRPSDDLGSSTLFPTQSSR